MPTYEYRCRSCHESFTLRSPIAEAPAGDVTCPKCKSREVERLLSGFYAKTARKS